MFDVIGLSPDTEQVYEVLLGRSATLGELASATGMARHRVQAAIRSLEEYHLAGCEPGTPLRYRAADPAVAMDVLLLKYEQDLKQARTKASELAERYRLAASRRDPAELVEICRGRNAVLERVDQAQRAARAEIRGFDKPPYAGEPTRFNGIEADLLRRGGTSRVVYERAAIDIPGFLPALEEGIGLGEQARALPYLPTKLVIVDDSVAILPLPSVPEAIECSVVVHKSALFEAITALFEMVWAIAVPLQLTGQNDDQEEHPSALERQILALLTAGLPDDAIARHLGLSERTFQRRMRDLMDFLHAQTRFQLARQATRHGWLDDLDQPADLAQRASRGSIALSRRGGNRRVAGSVRDQLRGP